MIRLLRFNLRAMLVVVAMFSACLGVPVHFANQQRRAVERIQQLGGRVEYSLAFDLQRLRLEWLRDLIGDQFFVRVVTVSLAHTEVRNSDLAVLKSLPYITRLGLGHTGISDDGLAHLRDLRYLRGLTCDATEINGSGFKFLTGEHLYWLRLNETRVGDAAAQQLARMPKLKIVYLSYTELTDEGIGRLASSASLASLHIEGTKVTGEGFKRFNRGSTLHSIFAAESQLSDEGLEHIGRLTSLERLELQGTPVTEKGLAYLTDGDHCANCSAQLK